MTRVTGQIKITTRCAQETHAFGRRLALHLRSGDILCCYGGLGTGKTTMIKGIADGLRVKSDYVHSPTFVVMNVYENGRLPLYHFDLYRMETALDIFDIGYDEFLYGDGVSVIEWSERLGRLKPRERLDIHLRHRGEIVREIGVRAVGERYQELVRGVKYPAVEL